MLINDQINRFLFDDTDIRGEIVSLEKAYQNAIEHQKLPQPLVPVFGEFLAAATLLSEVLKFEGTLTLQARGNGDVAIIMAETTHDGNVRGILRVNPEKEEINLDDLSLKSLLGEGLLTITIDPEKGRRYQGIVPIDDDDLATCLESYFKQSEQLPTHIKLFANAKHCGGLFLQCLPAQLVTDLEAREDQWQTRQQLASTLTAEEVFDLANEEVLLRLFHEMQCRVFEPKTVRFICSCDRERSASALQSLGFEDALALIREREVISIDCEFCGKTYRFNEHDLAEIFPNRDAQLH